MSVGAGVVEAAIVPIMALGLKNPTKLSFPPTAIWKRGP